MKTNQRGFAPIILIITIILLVASGLFVFSYRQLAQKEQGQQKPNSITDQTKEVPEAVVWYFRYEWEPSGSPPPCPDPLIQITPVDISKATSILYPGQVRGGHYKAHGGFGFENSNPDNITVRMPQDGAIVSGVRYYELGELQYLFDIDHPCGIRFRFDHLRILSPKFQEIADRFPPPKVNDTRGTRLDSPVEVKAGEIVAIGVAFKNAANTLTGIDFGMYDLRRINDKAKGDPVWAKEYWGDQAPYALCWLDLLPVADRTVAKSLPCPGGSFTCREQSDYCKYNE